MTENLSCVIIYTDGGCRPNPGPGGWGAVLLHSGRDPVELSGGKREATNNRMEMVAAIEALGALDGSHRVELYTDSTYLKKGITEWLSKWRAKGWKTAAKKDVKNRDLWEELDKALQIHEVSWHWTKGTPGPLERGRGRARVSSDSSCAAADQRHEGRAPLHRGCLLGEEEGRIVGSGAALCGRGEGPQRPCCRRVGQPHAPLERHLGLEELKRRVRVHLYTVSDYLKAAPRRGFPAGGSGAGRPGRASRSRTATCGRSSMTSPGATTSHGTSSTARRYPRRWSTPSSWRRTRSS